jgi:hypothetical protein
MKWLKLSLVMLLFASIGFAGEIDLLLEKLVQKGIITSGEAEQIKAETDTEIRNKVIGTASKEIEAQSKISSFLKNTKFKGDIRLRYQYEDKDSIDRHRGRFRFRYGFETKVNDMLKIGMRLTTGSDHNSGNQSFDTLWNSKGFYLDRAYAKLALSDTITLIGGKMSNPFEKTHLVWDGDISPEGIGVKFDFPVASNVFVNAGFFPIAEDSKYESDPYMYGIQAGYSGKPLGGKFKAAVAYYGFEGMKGVNPDKLDAEAAGNTLDGGKYKYGYNPLDFLVSFDIPNTPITLFGDYVKNIASNVEEDTGWLAGIALKHGQWKFSYNYERIEADCVPGFLPDSDFNGGGTGSKGHGLKLGYKLNSFSSLGLTYIIGEDIE